MPIVQKHPTPDTTGDKREVKPPPVFPPVSWTLERLIEACRNKGIRYEETRSLTSLRGFAVNCGRTYLINVRANLPGEEKLFTLAHELGHIALGRMHTTTLGQVLGWLDTSLAAFQDTDQEDSADLWAAHLLVAPEVFAQCLVDVQTRTGRADASRKAELLASAMRQTAEYLGVPPHAVETWYAHQDECPAPAPADWLGGT